MKKVIFGFFLLLSSFVVACAAQTPTASAPTAVVTRPAKTGTMRFALNGLATAYDVTWLMALDALKAQGYNVETVSFAKSDLIVPALVNADIDVASANTNSVWTAIGKQADIRTVVSRTNMTFYLVAKSSVATCRDLDGRTVAFSDQQSVGYVMFQKYLKDNCPGTTPKVILITQSANRVVALQAGQIDGAYLQIEDWLQLSSVAPDKFHFLINFGKEYPQVQYSTYSVRRVWAQQNAEMVKDFIRALLLANRSVLGNSQMLQNEFATRLTFDATQAKRVADAYLTLNVWDPNGGLTETNLGETLDFLTTNGAVPQGLQVKDVADLSYLNAVLDEIGRK